MYRAAETKYININMNIVCSETKNPSVSLTRRMLSYCVRRRVHPPIREISPIILLVFILIILILIDFEDFDENIARIANAIQCPKCSQGHFHHGQ